MSSPCRCKSQILWQEDEGRTIFCGREPGMSFELVKMAIDDFERFGRFEETLDRIIREAQAASPPRILYHYTKTAGFSGIISSGKFWATSVYHCTDPTELRYGLDLVKTVLQEEAQCVDSQRPFLERINWSLETQKSAFDLYVVCFSESGQNNHMWRNYAQEEYCVGLNPEKLASVCGRPRSSVTIKNLVPVESAWLSDPGLSLSSVEYCEVKQKQLIRKLVRHAAGFYPEVPHQVGKVSATLAHFILRCLCSFKQSCFGPESEWRVVRWCVGTGPEVLLRKSPRGACIPYVELDVFREQPDNIRLCLETIRYGASVPDPRNIRVLLARHGYGEQVRVEPSHAIRL